MHQQDYSMIEKEVSDPSRPPCKLEKMMVALSLATGAGMIFITNTQYFQKLYGMFS